MLIQKLSIVIFFCVICVHGYRDGAREESCYNHTVIHDGDVFFGDCVPSTCRYFLVIKKVVNEATLELGNVTNTYECGKIYGIEVANNLNAPEGFLVQARNGTSDSSEIIGTFLHPDVVTERTGNTQVNYKILQCRRSEAEKSTSPLLDNSATQPDTVNMAGTLQLYWQAPECNNDPCTEEDHPNVTVWFTIVQQLLLVFNPSKTTVLNYKRPSFMTSMPSISCTTAMPYTTTSTTPITESTSEFEATSLTNACAQEEVTSNSVVFKWPDTAGGSNASFTCPNNRLFTVSRKCFTGGQWGRFDDKGCGVLAPDFEDISMAAQNLTNETLVETVETLSTLVQMTESSPVEQNMEILNNIASTLISVASFVNNTDIMIDETVVEDVVEILNSITQWTPTAVFANTSSLIVQSFETVTLTFSRQIPPNSNRTQFRTTFVTVTAENAAVETLQVTGRNFSIGDSRSTGSSFETAELLPPHQDAAISLPASLFRRVNDRENVGVFFAFYKTATLFPVGGGSSDREAPRQTQVGSQILAATVDSAEELVDLEEPVTVVFRLQVADTMFTAPGSEMCASWNFTLQDWTPRGCNTSVGSEGIVTCTCSHLTNFAMLVDICLRQEDCQPSKIDELLTYISYIGMPISIVCLVVTILTLVLVKELRQKEIFKYHIQLSLSLLFMLIVALVVVILSAEKAVPYYGGCVTLSILVHYFALVAVLLMAAEALLMFRKLTSPFALVTNRYNIIVSIICWAVPMLPVAIPLIVDLSGGNDPGDDIVVRREEEPSFCFLSHVGAFWGAFLAPILTVMLFNSVLFVCITVIVIVQVRRRSKRKGESTSLKNIFRTTCSIFGLMCLFGFTWLFAILTFSASGLRETFQVLFTIFNSLQGASIFIFICVLSPDAREGWKSLFYKKLHFRLTQYTSASKSNTYSSRKSNDQSYLKGNETKSHLEQSLTLRTFSDSKIPEKDGENELLSDVDYESEYQLQVKPKSHQLGSQSQGIAEVEIVAVALKMNDSENCDNVESSVTIFVNNDYMDMEKSIQRETPAIISDKKKDDDPICIYASEQEYQNLVETNAQAISEWASVVFEETDGTRKTEDKPSEGIKTIANN